MKNLLQRDDVRELISRAHDHCCVTCYWSTPNKENTPFGSTWCRLKEKVVGDNETGCKDYYD